MTGSYYRVRSDIFLLSFRNRTWFWNLNFLLRFVFWCLFIGMNELSLSVKIEIIKFLRAGRGCNWIARRVFCHKETVWHYRELDKQQGYFRGLLRELFLSCRGRFLIHHSLRVDPVVIQGLPAERLAAYIKTGKVEGVLKPGCVATKTGSFSDWRGDRRL